MMQHRLQSLTCHIRRNLLATGILTISLACYGQHAAPAYMKPSLPTAQRVDDLVSRMTLEEKVSQMENNSVAIPRLGIPAYNWWNEGLHGIARSGYATVFPQAIGMAATWDIPLIYQESTVISTEARAKYEQAIRENNHSIYFGLTVWSPNINIFRDPRWGRGQETYGEDPYLTSRIGVAFVEGLQGDNAKYFKVIATPKHYAVHSGPESERHRFNVNVSPYDLESTYLPAFRATITEAHADSIMCAYNAIDGVPACANHELLQHYLRGAWRFQGFVTSDCGAIDDFSSPHGHHYAPDHEHGSALAVIAGTDTTCGTEYTALVQAVKDGLIKESEIDTAVKHLFTARFRLGMFDPPQDVPYAQIPFSANNTPAHRQLALEAAEKSIVLLKNQNGFLPLKPSIKIIAVVGPNAAALEALEGNYNAIPSDPVLPLDGLRSVLGSNVRVLYAQGSSYADSLPAPAPRTLFHPASGSTQNGLSAEYFNDAAFSGQPVLRRVDPGIDFDWNAASPAKGIGAKAFSVRWQGTITPPAAGDYTFNVRLSHCYPCNDKEVITVFMDGKQITQQATNEAASGRTSLMQPFVLHFADTHSHTFQLDYTHASPLFGAGLTLLWQPPADALRRQAVNIAKQADAVVAFVGLSPNLEGEEMKIDVKGFNGGDRTNIQLPEVQQQLLQSVAATGKPLVVVLLNGSALAVNWAQQHAAAILDAWYPGEAGGTAIAETLIGKNNPAGRLPVTFYRSIDQLPSFENYSMQGRTYRYFTGKPLYPFGYGLSYTKFAYSNIKLSSTKISAGDTLTVEADVKNIGDVAGDEVSELYLSAPASDDLAKLSLSGFQRSTLQPNATRHLVFHLEPRQISTVNLQGKRAVRAGEYTVYVGGGQPQDATDLKTTFTVTGEKSLPE
ncbi:MAG: glycoside hydrolase family 3 C-terminal domain-containing protein [Acidobacteriaceae bacterium]